ncbi:MULTISPECIES: beta-glucoside-specific PTS transporter subunit IIABC [Microbacterium]|uniref:beta-glucoside-specific PTS transporter subunit IIABC n=1 Tax=Microbacterium TaxID=33882 RepID=UPI002782C356|nr:MULTISPECIES: beta-glucoside-specific PTS transporter subunit IIABC [Microbacterium]MDQ1085328.1 PTS system beta-glucosides-specific IIC component [Microbacterium sp. SORGH_AS_0344]MDQ1169367.1 PTS system beta-glucosides-specific IIC component [Microbacterium proteolyticum]
MTDHAKTAAAVLTGVGGEGNITSMVHCATRLRFVLKDEGKADAAALRATPGVITTAQAGGQYQVVIGNDVPEVFAAIQAATKGGGSDTRAGEAPTGNPFNRFIRMIAAIFTPVLWALAGTGLLKAFLAAAVTFGWMDTTTTTYTILNALSDAFLTFLPLALAITAARYFRAAEFTSLAIAGALVYPSIVALNGQPDITFFGIPVTMVSYVSSVIPIIVIVWLQAYAERFLLKVLPSAVRRFLTPMIVVLIAVPLVFVVIGPLSNLLGTTLASGIGWIFQTVPWLGGAILGGLWQVFVIFGLHWGFVPLFQLEYQTTGSFLLFGPVFAAVLAQGGAVAGVLARTRNRNLRSLAAPATLSALLAGITEPAIYGITLPLKRPFAFGIVGGVIGGAIVATGGVFTRAFVVPSGLALPALLGNGDMVLLAIGLGAAVVVPFVLVVLFGFADPVDESVAAAPAAATDTVVSNPVDGTVVPLAEVPDAAFADASLGKGVAIRPTSGAVYAPFDGTVVAAFPTGHAIGLRGVDGVELLIHVGLDTVKLGGQHFALKVQSGAEVKAGDLLLEFDGDAIEKAGYDLITPVIVTNGDLYPDIADAASGPLSHGETLFRAVSVDSLSTAR